MTLLSRAKAMPLPATDTAVFGVKVYREDALHAAREQIAAEGDEVIGRLCRVVDAHVSDLRECIPTLKGFGLSATAAEVAKACDELSAALAEARKA